MEQARFFVCGECSTPVPTGHKFCGRCGAVVPPEILEPRTRYFGAMQAPGRARLILIRGKADGTEGLSYLLQGSEHFAGTGEAEIPFTDDPWLSDRHANFLYRGDKLVVRDEGSDNGVYLRLRESVTVEPGDQFLCGEQVLRVEGAPPADAGQTPDMTYFYASPRRPSPFLVSQVLVGGDRGMCVGATEGCVTIGREGSDMNFPGDEYMSGAHAKLELAGESNYTLSDLDSQNGTFLRIRGETDLSHGDYVFLGAHLLRVEITS